MFKWLDRESIGNSGTSAQMITPTELYLMIIACNALTAWVIKSLQTADRATRMQQRIWYQGIMAAIRLVCIKLAVCREKRHCKNHPWRQMHRNLLCKPSLSSANGFQMRWCRVCIYRKQKLRAFIDMLKKKREACITSPDAQLLCKTACLHLFTER